MEGLEASSYLTHTLLVYCIVQHVNAGLTYIDDPMSTTGSLDDRLSRLEEDLTSLEEVEPPTHTYIDGIPKGMCSLVRAGVMYSILANSHVFDIVLDIELLWTTFV